MFALVVAGRPVDAAPQAITATQYAFKVPATPAFNHIVVFLLPGAVLPQGAAAAVYLQLPPTQEFRFLGGIGPGKESAIFKVNGVDAGAKDDMAPDQAGGDIVVGIAIQAGEEVDAQLAALKAQSATPAPSTALVRTTAGPPNPVSTKQLAKNIIGNAFDFLASFGSDTVPLRAFQDWWTKFEKKVDRDASFLERARD